MPSSLLWSSTLIASILLRLTRAFIIALVFYTYSFYSAVPSSLLWSSTLITSIHSAGGVEAVLGQEILECLYWRVGALLYMYCYAVFTKEERRRKMDASKFLKVCNSVTCPQHVEFEDPMSGFYTVRWGGGSSPPPPPTPQMI